MPSSFWTPIVNPVQTGEPVDAATTNRPILQLSEREQYLFEQVTALNQKGGRLVAGAVELGAGAVAGSIVYFNGSTGRYEPALATFSYTGGQAVVAASTRACGLVLSTDGFGTGDVLLRGVVNPADFGLNGSAMLDRATDQFSGGAYYLSRLTAGSMTPRPSSPVVPLGFFDVGGFVFDPLAVGELHPHLHTALDLYARPAASQNYARTGFSSAGHFVDYCFQGAGTPPVIALGIRGQAGQTVQTPTRVDVTVDGSGLLSFVLFSGAGLDYLAPSDTSATATSLGSQAWPQYGEYVAVPGTGLEVFFFRTDGQYNYTTLTADVAALLSDSTDYFRIFLPDDTRGWTNANPFDPATPPGARLRYVIEGDAHLSSSFPPVPAEAASLTLNGVALEPGPDFLLTPEGLWWSAPPTAVTDPTRWGNAVGDPWPIDWSAPAQAAGTLAYANSHRLRFFFAQSDYRAGDAAVTSLRSDSVALTVTRCPGGEIASTGDLHLDLNLALAADPVLADDAETAFTSADGITFKSTSVVTRLVAGDGIGIDRVSTAAGSLLRGPLRISRKDVALEGEISSIALRGAGEILYHQNVIPYLNFKRLDGRPGSTGAVATFKLPAGSPSPTRLEIKSAVMGDTALSSTSGGGRALFRVVYQAIRPGTALSALSDATALAVQYWTYLFPASYVAFTLAPTELPTTAAGAANSYALTPVTLNVASPLFATGGLQGNDTIAVYFSRVAASVDGTLMDNYAGQVGFLGLRWAVSSV